MRTETRSLRHALRALGIAGIVVAGLLSLVGSGGGAIGFPPCNEPWCNQPPPPTVAVDPPFVTAQVGSAVTFTARARDFIGATTYQWSRSTDGQSWVALPGATAPTLTLPAVSLADDQAVYRVQVTGDDAISRWASAMLTVSSAPGIVFQDGDFDPAQWQATPREYPPGSLPVVSDSRETEGGNPGAWLRMSYRIPADTGGASVLYLRADAVYDPTVHGAIYVIDFAEDCRMLQTSETKYAETQLVVEQAGRRYVAVGGAACTSTVWNQATRRSSLRAADFRLGAGPECSATEACPDFSAGAPPLVLGFQRSVWGSPGDTIGHGIDNWRVTVWRR